MTGSPARPSRERFVLLDGLRGVAAVFIVQRHATEFFGDELPSSYLGVDLFFGLSGFVLAHAYGSALRNDALSAVGFMKARLARLYPLYGLALLLMTGFFLFLYATGKPTPLDDLHRPIDPGELALGVLTGILFIPSPVRLTLNGALFLVHPAWSLFNELVANLFYGIRGARATPRQVAIVLLVSGAFVVVAAIEFGRLHAGFRWNEMYAGMARVFFSFFVGVLVYQFRYPAPRPRPLIAVACLVFVAVVLAFPTPKDARAVFDLMVVFLAWPALLYLASAISPGRVGGTVSSFLGTASYAVYVLHVPLLAWTQLFLPELSGPAAYQVGIAFVIGLTVVCWYATVIYDQPLQRRLKHRLRQPAPHPAE